MELDLTCDVCIIGGNIAGSYLAYLLAHSGVDVIVVEQNHMPGIPMQCAGIVSQRFTNIVEIDPSIILNRVNTAWLYSENGKKVSVSIQDNPYILDRIKLDQHFYQKAVKSGARYFLGEKFIDLKKDEDYVEILTTKRTITAQIIVGCDGPNSRVAKLHGIRHKLIPAMQVRAYYDHPSNSVQMHFKQKWKNLFGWVIPEGNGVCRIGLGCEKKLRNSFQLFLKELHVDKSEILEKFGGQIIIGCTRKIAFNRAILLGDAAGMVKATTGGGINTLLRASKEAEKVILEAIKRNKFSKRFLVTHYEKSKIIRHLKLNIFLHFLIRIVLTEIAQEEYDIGFLLLNQPKTKELLLKYGDMDFPVIFILKMLLRGNLWVYIAKIIPSILRKLPEFLRKILEHIKY